MFTKNEREFATRFFALGRALLGQRAVKDAFMWREPGGRLAVAWLMEPLAMALRFGFGSPDAEGTQTSAVQRLLVAAFGKLSHSDFDYRDTIALYDLLSRLSNTFGGLDLMEGQPEAPFVTVIPEPGWPWPTEGEVYFSAKRQKDERSRTPEWLIEVPGDERIGRGTQPGVDLCALMGMRPTDGSEAGLGDAVVARFPGEDVIVTHVVSARGGDEVHEADSPAAWAAAGRSVRACGGLLFPSLAVGPVPATNFGACVLVARVGLALQGVKPYRPRGRVLTWLYDTDAWTGRVGDYRSGWAIAAFDQMHGHSDYMYTIENHAWPLGAPGGLALHGGPVEPTPIETTKRLNADLKRRFKVWKRDLSPAGVELVQQKVTMTQAHYAYLEAKVNGVTPMDAFPVAVCPERHRPSFEGFLEAAGWRGDLIVLPVPDDILDASEGTSLPAGMPFERRKAIQTWASLQYGWHVADALRKRGPAVTIEP